jgi:hypothetical protein
LPNYDEHIKKYRENKELIKSKLKIENDMYHNWIVTIAFYAAVHLVESELAKDKIDSPDHTGRKNNIDRFNKFRDIRVQYKTLYDRSKVARYEATFMNKNKSTLALNCLEQIENYLHITET